MRLQSNIVKVQTVCLKGSLLALKYLPGHLQLLCKRAGHPEILGMFCKTSI